VGGELVPSGFPEALTLPSVCGCAADSGCGECPSALPRTRSSRAHGVTPPCRWSTQWLPYVATPLSRLPSQAPTSDGAVQVGIMRGYITSGWRRRQRAVFAVQRGAPRRRSRWPTERCLALAAVRVLFLISTPKPRLHRALRLACEAGSSPSWSSSERVLRRTGAQTSCPRLRPRASWISTSVSSSRPARRHPRCVTPVSRRPPVREIEAWMVANDVAARMMIARRLRHGPWPLALFAPSPLAVSTSRRDAPSPCSAEPGVAADEVPRA